MSMLSSISAGSGVPSKSRRNRPGPLRLAALAIGVAGLGGCDHFDVREAASRLPPYVKPVDRPKTLIDTALDLCPDKTEDREAGCVRQALLDRHLGVGALAAMVPGCRIGRTCLYDHTSDDRLGYVAPMAADFVVRWRVSFDLAHHPAQASDAPITVEQR